MITQWCPRNATLCLASRYTMHPPRASLRLLLLSYERPSMNSKKTLPIRQLKFIFCTQIYHPNINLDGAICLGFRKAWKPVMNLKNICYSLLAILQDPNPLNPLNTGWSSCLRSLSTVMPPPNRSPIRLRLRLLTERTSPQRRARSCDAAKMSFAETCCCRCQAGT